MTDVPVTIVYPVVQFDGLIPVVPVGASIKTIVARSFGRILHIGFFCISLHVKGGGQGSAWNVVEVVLGIKCLLDIIVLSEVLYSFGLAVRVVLTCHVVGYEIDECFQSGTVCPFNQMGKLLHAVRHTGCQVRIYIIIILDGVG